jgi:membrane protease subunit HflK
MRQIGSPSEIRRLAAPLVRIIDIGWRRMHWWVATMALLYVMSGITIVRPDEVAVVLRWGRLVGGTTALQQHGPGLVFTLPRPIDRVVRVQVKHVWEVPISTLDSDDTESTDDNNHPIVPGYAVTGDDNIVHLEMVARYRVRDPALWAFYGPKSEDVLRAEVTAAMVRSIGEMGVDRVLSDGRETLVAIATRRAQQGLDDCQSGLELSLLELTSLTPPVALRENFDAVQTSYIGAQTAVNEAQAFAASAVPRAQAAADAALQSAKGDAAAALATAHGDAGAFIALERQYRADPAVIRERLYRDAIDRAIGGAGQVRWIPPPVGGNYHGMVIRLGPLAAGPSTSASASAMQRTPPNAAPLAPAPTGQPQVDDDDQ